MRLSLFFANETLESIQLLQKITNLYQITLFFSLFPVYTLSGNDHNAPCVFPFYYDGKNYTSCTYKDCKHNLPWCATTNNYDRDKKWGHCQTDKDVTDCIDLHSRCGTWAMDGECVVNAPYMCQKCPRSCGLCTHGGNGRGKPCKFPFFFKNRLVYNCLRFNKKTWCATTTDYNKDKRWGYCFPKCKFWKIRRILSRNELQLSLTLPIP